MADFVSTHPCSANIHCTGSGYALVAKHADSKCEARQFRKMLNWPARPVSVVVSTWFSEMLGAVGSGRRKAKD